MPTEAPNTLRSRAKFKIVDIISQGPIKGIVNGAQSIFLDDTPIQNENGASNFPNIEPDKSFKELPVYTGGLKKFLPLAIFPASENEVSVATKVTKNSPEGSGSGDGSVTRTITDANLDYVSVTMRVPALTTTNTSTGDITGGSIRFKIEVQPNGGAYRPITSGSKWTPMSSPSAETVDGATGIELTAMVSGNKMRAQSFAFQYCKKTGGSWGSWITYSTVTIPATSSSTSSRGFNNQYWYYNQPYTKSITGLEPGIYRARCVALNVGTTATASAAREYAGGYIEIQGKTVSPYDASYLVPLPEGGAPWNIKVTRLSDDTPAANIQDDLYWFSYTEQISNRFDWPNLAGVQITIDAESFGGNVPNRSYDVMGLLVQIPANYDPYERTYAGVWNGTFKTDWTDNPAWIFYDLLTNKRYGLGDNIDATQIDKYALYQIAQYCDELVDAPNGEQEPRYTCSCVINSQSEAYELLTAIASAFRGMIYHSGGMITPVADMPSDPVLNVGPANVIDGVFTYQGASRKARHTVARVSWNNPDDGYKLNVELYEDDEAIRKYGYRPIDINAFGCTSRGLARRWGKWAIVSDNDAPDTVTYKAGFDHFQLRPGDVINIADPNYSGEQLFGLIADVIDNGSPATHTIKLDRAVTRVAGDTSELQLTLPDGTILALDVAVLANTTTDEITVDSAELTTIPLAGASWLLKKGTVEPRQWRVISISEDEPHIYQVTAMLYDPNKYDSIETGLNFAEADFTAFPSGPLPAPTGLAISEFLKQSGSAILECATFSWVRPADARAELFEVQYQADGKDWQATTPNLTGVTSVDIINIVPGTYNFRVRAQDSSGIFRSEWATLASQTLEGKSKAPEDVTGFSASIEKFGVLLSWNKVSDIDIDYYEIRTGASWAAGTTIGKVKATTFKYEDATTGAYTFWIKALDTQTPANESATAASVSATISAQGTPVVVATSVNGGIQIDIAGAVSRGFSHYEIKRRSYPAGTEVTINDNVLTRRFTDTDITTLGYVTQWQYSVRAIDQNAAASAWSDYTTQLSPKMIETLDITANQIVAKDFRTALDVGKDVDGVKFTADGIEMWEDGARKVLIPTSGDPEFAGLLTAAAGYIGGWQIFPTYLQSSNIKLDSAGLLQTLDFVSGNKGWKINQDGNAEFNNIRARGAVKTVVFEKDEISVVGGRTLIRPAGVVKDYDYADFINAAGGAYLEDCWDKLNELLGTNYTYVAPVFADYAEYYAAEMAYYDELCVAMGFNQFACAIEESAYDDATKDAYLTACWSQLMTLLDLTTTTPAIPSMTFSAFKALENGYFDEVAEAIDNPPVFEPFISDADTAIETDNADQFAIGDIVRIKDGLSSDYWGRVSAISGDIVSITGESGEPFAITAGQTIVNYGIPGSGGILLDGQGPMMDVYTHDGAPWNGTDLRLRIGNLNGWGTINDDIYGIAIGNPTGEYLVYDSTSGRLRLNGAIQISEGTGIANFSDAGALAGLDDIDLSYVTDAGTLASANNLDDVVDGTTYKKTTANEKTGASRAYSGLDSSNRLVTAVIPTTAVTPAGAGLFLGSNYLGYHSGSAWRTYMDSNGNFALIGAGTHGLSWNGNTLSIVGNIDVKSTLPLSMPAGAVGEWSAKGATTATIALAGGVKDVSGNANHAQASGGTTVISDSEMGSVFGFDGINDSIVIGFTTEDIAEFSVSVFYKRSVDAVDALLDTNYTSSNLTGFRLGSGGYTAQFTFMLGGKRTGYINYKNNEWTHVVGTFSGGQYLRLYENGILISENIVDIPLTVRMQQTLIGRNSSSAKHFTGQMVLPKMYKRALSAEEVKSLYLIGNQQESGVITADRVQTGVLQSLNWGTSAGSCFNMNDGKFTLGGSSAPKLSWNGTTLNVVGNITITGGSGYGNLTDKPTNLADINSTEGGKLTGIEAGADVTSTHTSADTSNVAGTAAATVRDNAANALANAATAQSTATTALNNAATANNLLANIAADNKLTPVEKQSARKEWDIIATEQPINSLHAMNIVGFSAGIAEGSFNETASDAYWSECWTKLNTLLGESNVEPAFAAQTYTAFVAEESSYYTLVKQVIDSEIITVPPSPDILALNSAYVAAFQALATYLNAGSTWSSGVPSWISDANLSATDTIVGATFRSTWKAYYDARTALLNAIAAKSKIIADLAQDTAGSVTLRVDTTLDANNRVTTAVIPTTSIAPDRAGLFMGANYMGFHNGDEWKTYMDANGNFALAGTTGDHGLTWDSATNVLTVAGTVNATSGNIGGFSVSSSEIFVSGTSGGGYGGKVRLNATTGDIGCQYAYFKNSSNNGGFSVVLNLSGLESNRSETISGTTYTDKMQFRPTSGNTYDNAPLHIQLATSSYYAFYTNANVYIGNNCSALSFTDRTEMPESMEEALEIINTMQPINGKVDYKRLSKKAKKSVLQKNIDGTEYVEDGRDLTKTVSALVMACQKLLADNSELVRRIEYLEKDKRNEK